MERGYCDTTEPWDEPVEVDDLITPDECLEIIKLAEPKFARSSVIGKNVPDDDRTSETAWIPRSSPIAQKIFEKACELTGKPMENCEDLQVVRYRPGMFYKPHHDSCCENSEGCFQFEKNGGQRVGTLLVYLNDDFTDGMTHFPNINKKFKSPPGSGLFFRPMNEEDTQCHPLALHGGMPPTEGTKYLCNAWVRENNFVVPH
jgi:prolyl 4-hydroxylase